MAVSDVEFLIDGEVVRHQGPLISPRRWSCAPASCVGGLLLNAFVLSMPVWTGCVLMRDDELMTGRRQESAGSQAMNLGLDKSDRAKRPRFCPRTSQSEGRSGLCVLRQGSAGVEESEPGDSAPVSSRTAKD